MKYIILTLLFMAACTYMRAQEYDEDNSPITFTEVVKMDSISKESLYDAAVIWIAEGFYNPTYIVKIKDREQGIIKLTANFNYNSDVSKNSRAVNGVIKFELNIFFKDGRYKYEITNFYHDAKSRMDFGLITNSYDCTLDDNDRMKDVWYDDVWTDLKVKVNEYAETLENSLKSGINENINSKKDDW